MKKELIVGEVYTLKYTKSFCHTIGEDGFQDFSKGINPQDTLDNCKFVGLIELEHYGERQIFYRQGSGKRIYVMFSNENLKHVL